MRATEALTEAYHAAHPGLHFSILGRTGLRVSGAGFGGYRVSIGVEAHHMALRRGLAGGINLVDTSANYADGGSEELIGATIDEMERAGTIARGEIVVVTKGGYIQGSNYTMARERAEAGSGFPDVVEYGQGLWHSIAPEFLEDQISRSLARLGMSTIDLYLLHNPEYYLSWAAKSGIGLDAARREYYRRIRDAFAYLETEVERGRIAWYGISSNSFPHAADADDFTSLEECVGIAERISLVHHFAAIQFPANLVENGFVARKNQSGGRTLIDVAREKNLGVLINRPLNAITGGELIRLADFPLAALPLGETHINDGIEKLMALEEEFARGKLTHFAADAEGTRALREFISVGGTLREHWDTFGSIEHFNDILSQHFAPRLGFVAQYFREHGAPEHLDWYNGYVATARALFQAIAVHYSRAAQERSTAIKADIATALGADAEGTLSSLAIRLLLGVEGVSAALVGMRREEYVDDVLHALRLGPIGDRDAWGRLEGAVWR